jgi:hypothetical protein
MQTLLAAVLCCVAIIVPSNPNETTKDNQRKAHILGVAAFSFQEYEESNTHGQETKDDSPKWYVALKRPEWWLVVAAFFTLGAIWKQAKEMRKATKAMRESTEAIQRQVGIMERQTKATEMAAVAAQEGVKIIISKERARIMLEPGTLKLAPPDDPLPIDEVTFKVFCYGTTPAFILERFASVRVTDSEEPPTKLPNIPMPPLPPVFSPSIEGIEKTTFIFENLGDEQRDAIRKGKLFIHFYGFIQYRHVFDTEGICETKFRYIWKWSSLPAPPDLEASGFWLKCGPKSDNDET